MKQLLRCCVVAMLGASGCSPVAGRAAGESIDPIVSADSAPSPMKYHGGPVLELGPNVYVIWYGDWGTGPGAARPILTDFIVNLSGSDYWNILHSYDDRNGIYINALTTYAGEIEDHYSAGKSVADYHAVIVDHIDNGDLPEDPNGVYLFLPYVDVALPGLFCAKSCGSHNHLALADGTEIQVAYVGHPGRCLSACGGGTHKGITGNYGADWMPSTIAHELAEATTDPHLDAWADGNGREIGDKCNRQYGATYKTKSGGDANISLGGRDYLTQQLWVNSGAGRCAMSY